MDDVPADAAAGVIAPTHDIRSFEVEARLSAVPSAGTREPAGRGGRHCGC